MNLFLISQTENNDYDTYDSAVVCAPDEDTARHMDPSAKDGEKMVFASGRNFFWCSSHNRVNVKRLGDAVPGLPIGVVCASFNAG